VAPFSSRRRVRVADRPRRRPGGHAPARRVRADQFQQHVQRHRGRRGRPASCPGSRTCPRPRVGQGADRGHDRRQDQRARAPAAAPSTPPRRSAWLPPSTPPRSPDRPPPRPARTSSARLRPTARTGRTPATWPASLVRYVVAGLCVLIVLLVALLLVMRLPAGAGHQGSDRGGGGPSRPGPLMPALAASTSSASRSRVRAGHRCRRVPAGPSWLRRPIGPGTGGWAAHRGWQGGSSLGEMQPPPGRAVPPGHRAAAEAGQDGGQGGPCTPGPAPGAPAPEPWRDGSGRCRRCRTARSRRIRDPGIRVPEICRRCPPCRPAPCCPRRSTSARCRTRTSRRGPRPAASLAGPADPAEPRLRRGPGPGRLRAAAGPGLHRAVARGRLVLSADTPRLVRATGSSAAPGRPAPARRPAERRAGRGPQLTSGTWPPRTCSRPPPIPARRQRRRAPSGRTAIPAPAEVAVSGR
jgi:hypothetical protein